MQEILPGVLYWRAHHPEIGVDVSSYFLTESGMAIDPMLPPGEGPDWLGHDVRHVVVTIGLHTRSTPAFGLPIRVPREGLHRWEGSEHEVEPYDDGDELVPGVRAIQVGKIAPDDYVLHIATGPGILAIADAVFNYAERGFLPDEHEGAYEGIGFVPADLSGDDTGEVDRGTVVELRRLLDLDFDALLFSHGAPIASGGKAALRAFVEANS